MKAISPVHSFTSHTPKSYQKNILVTVLALTAISTACAFSFIWGWEFRDFWQANQRLVVLAGGGLLAVITAIYCCCISQCSPKKKKLISKRPKLPLIERSIPRSGKTRLMDIILSASKARDLYMLEDFLSKGLGDVNEYDAESNQSPLLLALHLQDYQIVQILLSKNPEFIFDAFSVAFASTPSIMQLMADAVKRRHQIEHAGPRAYLFPRQDEFTLIERQLLEQYELTGIIWEYGPSISCPPQPAYSEALSIPDKLTKLWVAEKIVEDKTEKQIENANKRLKHFCSKQDYEDIYNNKIENHNWQQIGIAMLYALTNECDSLSKGDDNRRIILEHLWEAVQNCINAMSAELDRLYRIIFLKESGSHRADGKAMVLEALQKERYLHRDRIITQFCENQHERASQVYFTRVLNQMLFHLPPELLSSLDTKYITYKVSGQEEAMCKEFFYSYNIYSICQLLTNTTQCSSWAERHYLSKVARQLAETAGILFTDEASLTPFMDQAMGKVLGENGLTIEARIAYLVHLKVLRKKAL